jgi:hypothetical protein
MASLKLNSILLEFYNTSDHGQVLRRAQVNIIEKPLITERVMANHTKSTKINVHISLLVYYTINIMFMPTRYIVCSNR